MCAKLFQSCPTPSDPMVHSPPGSSVHGILQARILDWVATSSSRGSSRPRDRAHISFIAGGVFPAGSPGEPSVTHRIVYIHINPHTFSLSKSISMFCFKHSLKINRWKKFFLTIYPHPYYFWCASFFPGNLSYYLVSFSFLLKNCFYHCL